MKTKNIIIAILIVVVLGQFVILVRQTRIKHYRELLNRNFQRIPIEVYVAGLTETINRNSQGNIELLAQLRWTTRHLGKCIVLLEEQRGLDPIPIKSEYPTMKDIKPPLPEKQEAEPFYIPYIKPPSHKDPNESNEVDLQRLRCMFNQNTIAIKMAVVAAEMRIYNYEERLQQLDPNQF